MSNFEEYGAFKEDSDLNYVISPEENSLAEMPFFISWDKKIRNNSFVFGFKIHLSLS